jgi:PAS domain S-box-containing protein
LSQRLDQILDQTAIAIAQIDKNGRYLFVNASYCELVGQPCARLLGGQMQDFMHPEDVPASLEAFISVLESRDSRIIVQRHVREDGSCVSIDVQALHR